MTAFIDPAAERVLIIMPSWVGDVVMATPVLRLLRAQRPEAKIIALMRPGLDALLNGLETIDEMIVDDMRGIVGVFLAASRIRAHSPNVGLLLPNSFRSALVLRLARVPVRIGYGRDRRRFLLTHAITAGDIHSPRPMVGYYLDLAAAALETSLPGQPRLELAVTEADHAEGERLLHDVDGSFVLLNPGANKEAKRWPAERFGEVGTRLANELNVRIVVTGSPKERGVVERVIALCDTSSPPINLVERGVTLGSLKAVVQRASLLITNDTGPRHIAAALGTPIVSLFGPTDHRWTVLPGVCERMLLAEPFLPEQMVADQYPQACEITRIAVGDVVAAAKSAPLWGRG